MEVINSRAYLLSNFEVLSLLRELEAEQLAETRAALTVKKERSENGQINLAGMASEPPTPEVCENLRTVEFEAIAHLSAPFQPVNRQTPQGIRKLTKALAPYGLTKGEKLQIINLAPSQPVELYVIVEEFEDRLSDKMDEIMTLVKDSLLEVPAQSEEGPDTAGGWDTAEDGNIQVVEEIEQQDEEAQNEGWDEADMMEFVDNEGAFEGDLDADDMDE